MVTTRRAPAPAGASSRANSAPAVPKTPKARKAAPEVPVVAVDNDLHVSDVMPRVKCTRLIYRAVRFTHKKEQEVEREAQETEGESQHLKT